ncbi:MAG: hypothetical protein AB1775_11460 [Bacteroidota bacterium]
MKAFSEYMGEEIGFVQPSFFKRIHELRVGDELIGSIQQKGFFGMTWYVSMLGKNWEIYKPSFWKTALEIREAGYEMPFATFKRDGLRSRGTLSLPMGENLKIVPHLFKKFCEITNESDDVFVRIKMKIAIGDKAEVTIEKKSETIDKYPWIVMLAYIVAIEQSRRARHH